MNIKINIGEILSKAGQIVWKFKVLWIFGILANCGGGNNSRFNFNSSSRGGSGLSNGQLPEALRPFENMRPEQFVREFMDKYMGMLAGMVLLLCVLWVVFYCLAVMGKTGLIKGANKADAGATSLSFGEIWTESTPYFGRMLGLKVLVGLPFFLILVGLLVLLGFAGFSVFSTEMSGSGIGALMIGVFGVAMAVICVVGLITLVVGMIVSQIENAIVIENLDVLAGLSRGWQIFKANILSIVVIALILGVISGISNTIIALPLLAIMIPVMIGMAASEMQNYFLPMVIAGGCFLLYLPVLLTLGGLIESYTQSVWTLTYLRLTANPENPAA